MVIPPRIYKIKLHPKVLNEDSKLFDERAKEKIKKKCKELLSTHPEEAGTPLRDELKGYFKLEIFSKYRIIYKIKKEEVFVFILAVGIRRDFEVYEEAIKRLKQR